MKPCMPICPAWGPCVRITPMGGISCVFRAHCRTRQADGKVEPVQEDAHIGLASSTVCVCTDDVKPRTSAYATLARNPIPKQSQEHSSSRLHHAHACTCKPLSCMHTLARACAYTYMPLGLHTRHRVAQRQH